MSQRAIKNAVYESSLPNLQYLAQVRRNITAIKASNPTLVRKELKIHHLTIQENSPNQLSHLLSLETELNHATSVTKSLSNFKAQPQINHKMRALIFDFLMYCHTRLNLSTSTLFLAFDILDRYASKFVIKSSTYQLIALTALWISSKYWDSKNRVATLKVLQSLCCNQFTAGQFKEMELHLLKSLNWSLCHIATYDSFIDMLLFLKTNNANGNELPKQLNINEIKLGAILLCELASFNLDLAFNYNQSSIALAAITIVSMSLNFYNLNKWEDLQLNVNDDNLINICKELLTLISDIESLPSSFKFKYMASKLGHGDSKAENSIPTSKRILDALQNYHIQLQVEELYRSQDIANSYPFSPDSTSPNGSPLSNTFDEIPALSSASSSAFSSPSYSPKNFGSVPNATNTSTDEPHVYNKNLTLNDQSMISSQNNLLRKRQGLDSCASALSPYPTGGNSNTAMNNFISPFASPDLFSFAPSSNSSFPNRNIHKHNKTLSITESIFTPQCSSGLPSRSGSTFCLPITPNTPSLLQSKMMKNQLGKRQSSISSAAGSVHKMGSHLRNSQYLCHVSNKSSVSSISSTSSFVKGHHKRASSSMDIDFFPSERTCKRIDSR
ncbi:Uncharacterized protein RNJ44_02565 [Nakaseomyces bracarensis]|uniref:Cyclin-like domain-containing protein n=1 Tax=Nakaseomyces bracarensis TaxID=273131 RepID=A0ABR4NM25_9SACH